MVFSDYRISSNYGWRIHPKDKTTKFHAGIDLVKSHKSIIKCFISGKVMHAGNGEGGTGLGNYGNVVAIKDGNGNTNIYAHLDSVRVKKGQNVSRGTIIGTQGKTGKVTGSHLHYEIRKGTSNLFAWTNKPENSTLNPTNYVNKNNGGSKRMIDILTVDGKRGQATIKRWQQFLGTTVDGEISKISPMIKAWQKFLNNYGGANVTEDGIEGKDTIKAGQRFFGTVIDGKISSISLFVKELQKFLNEYGR